MTQRIGIVAEDESDVEVVKALVRKIVPATKFSVKYFVGHGCGKIVGKCSQWASVLHTMGCTTLIILHDADDRNPLELSTQLRRALDGCAISRRTISVPIREIEAWLLTDNLAIQRAMNLSRRVERISNPQSIVDPKKKLDEIVYLKSGKQKRYVNSRHNPQIAQQLDLVNVRRCTSFLPLEEFVLNNLR